MYTPIKKRILKIDSHEIAEFNISSDGLLNIFFIDMKYFIDEDLERFTVNFIKKIVESEGLKYKVGCILNVQ